MKRSPGYLRWGRDAGCGLFTKKTFELPPTYTCETHKASGCTPDNRMAAVCNLIKYPQQKQASQYV